MEAEPLSREADEQDARGAEGDLDPVLHSENPFAVFALVLKLSYARSLWLVGEALASKYPTEGQWEALLRDTDFLDSAAGLAEVIDDIRALSNVQGIYDPELIAQAAAQHHGRALESIEPLVERLEVDANDLLAYLVG